MHEMLDYADDVDGGTVEIRITIGHTRRRGAKVSLSVGVMAFDGGDVGRELTDRVTESLTIDDESGHVATAQLDLETGDVEAFTWEVEV